MESRHQLAMDSAALSRRGGFLLGVLLLSLLWIAPVWADCPPDPPACCGGSRGIGGGGSGPPQPVQTIAPPPGSPPGGDDGGGGGDSGGGGGNSPWPAPGSGDGGHPLIPGPPPTPTPAPLFNRESFQQTYWCVAPPFGGCDELANLTVICDYGECWVVDQTCVTYEACTRGGDGGETPGVDPPCVPGYDAGGVYLECDGNGREGWDWNYYIYTWADVPPHRVQIRPFPRWLAGTEGTMCLSRSPNFSVNGGPEGAGLSEGFWSHTVNVPSTANWDVDEPSAGDIQDYRIGVRWRMVMPGEAVFSPPAPRSCWSFNERDWNVADGVATPAGCGECIGHTYETSSYGLPENGAHWFPELDGCDKVPSGNGQWTNPAYQVQVPTYWVAEWADEWYAWEQVGWTSEGCFYRDPEPIGISGLRGCSDGEHAGDTHWYEIAIPEYDWRHHFVGWYPVDLRQFGGADWWYQQWGVITTGAGPWCAYEYADPNPGNSVRIPVIEMQSVIVDGCRLDGTCGDLNAPDASGIGAPTVPPPQPYATTVPGAGPPEGCSLCP